MENEKNQKPFDEEAKREAENTQQNSSEEGKKMEIEITRYKAIVRAFNEPKKLAKLIIVIALIITLVFLGVTLIALVVKSYYPYKTVNSNEYGATVIQNEDNEVIYWLFNSADLWANSGIKVKKDDVISVRTSGAMHSAIHHLVDAANENSVLQDRWLNPMGGNNSEKARDKKRSEFRISPNHGFNVILMQVIPEDVELKQDNKFQAPFYPYLDGRPSGNDIIPDIYVIGAGREKLTIRKDGVLHFAVNDIVLTPRIIKSMTTKYSAKDLELGESPQDANKTELEYYQDQKFVDAWYVDNVGSYLIVIERKKQ